MKLFYKNTSLISEKEIIEESKKLFPYIQKLKEVRNANNYNLPEGSINLPFDTSILEEIKRMEIKKVTKNLKYIIDIGIGGSNLGTKAVYDSLYGYFDILTPDRFPKMIFADTNDPEFLSSLQNFLSTQIKSSQEVLINIISKSGGTTETISNFEVVFSALKKLIDCIDQRVVVTTDEGSKLYQKAKEKNIDILTLPKQVGGRYSVLSSVGLFPLAACKINIEKLVEGARSMVDLCLKEKDHPALISATLLYLQSQKGKNMNDNFFFHAELESLGKWYRQLMGESIGKNGKGITPLVSIGSTDLHSMVQLYLGGPKDKITTFISSKKNLSDVILPSSFELPLVSSIEGKNISTVMKAILEGVKMAYQKQRLPFMEIILDEVSEKSLGEFMQFKMIEMMYLGQFLEVNTFDQPEVELYKIETKKILGQ